MTGSMSDLLNAAGLLLGLVSVLYGLWFPQIAAAIERPVKVQPDDREPDYVHCRRVLRAYALPLGIASVLFAIISLPPAVLIVVNTARSLWNDPAAALRNYDPVRTSLVAVSLALITLALYIAAAAARLRARCLLQNPKRAVRQN